MGGYSKISRVDLTITPPPPPPPQKKPLRHLKLAFKSRVQKWACTDYWEGGGNPPWLWVCGSGGARGVARGGSCPPPPYGFRFFFYFFFFYYYYYCFCLSAERSVMAMMILPLLHYENLCWKFFEVGKKCVGVPPPPPPPLSDFFRAGAKFLASRSSSESFCPP